MTTNQALFIVTLCYVFTAAGGSLLFRFAELARGAPDPHRAVITVLWVALMIAAWLWSVAEILRGRSTR